MTSTDPARIREIVNSPEYQAALAAQIDYDATKVGQAKLDAALAEVTDPEQAKSLLARKVAGAQSGIARDEQVAVMAPVVHRGQPGAKEYSKLAHAREDLARLLGRAAAETVLWTRPSPYTLELVLGAYDTVAAAETALGYKPAGWRHPRLLTAAGNTERTPWLRAGQHREVEPLDVVELFALGMEATWKAGAITATGDPDAAFRWGYQAAPGATPQEWRITSAPDLAAWHKASTKG